ncbi:hypothetical protein [Synechococcus sp. PCC 7336]|uniref:hypothetical protein n=1 Tax=Synechococcus sp. PCC 7336 TaxID=195250 RepID=UPI000346CBAE|nr:hypothetical protein [Synechococcus sp. PCC 7336]
MSQPQPPVPQAASQVSLSELWAKKYLQSLDDGRKGDRINSLSGKSALARAVLEGLRFASSQAWSRTEALLAAEIPKQRIDMQAIDPWQIAEDSRILYEAAAKSYESGTSPERFSQIIAAKCGQIRAAHTAKDPRVLGFVSMQFHYTGQLLLADLPEAARGVFEDYFKVMDDHLYMPLQRSYRAAADCDYYSAELLAVRELMPEITEIAEQIAARSATRHPGYCCHSGKLNHVNVRISSIRDIEMFQIYLCLVVLEGSTDAVQKELFPLCVMLYPPLKVSWELVREMLNEIAIEIDARLSRRNQAVIGQYLEAFQAMYASDVLSDLEVWSHHPDTLQFMNAARDLMGQYAS